MINNHMKASDRECLLTNSRFIFHPNQNKGWAYAHHPFITVFKNCFYAVFSNGIEKEDRPHQRVMLSVSYDGIHWSEPEVLFASIEDRQRPGVLTPGGFHIESGQLICYAGLFEFEDEAYRSGDYSQKAHSYANLYAKTTSDGEVWSGVIDLQLPVLPNHGPQRLASGRLLICGNFTFPRTDDPSGLRGWTLGGIYPRMWSNFMDTPYGHTVNTRELDCGTALCEGSFFQTPDGVIHMLLRSLTGKLWLTESRDNGETWSKPRESGFTDCGSKFHFGKTKDVYYAVSTPDAGSPRFPLVLSLSANGVCFDRQFIISDTEPESFVPPVARKGKIYGYPHSCVVGDTMYIVASLCKSAILFFKVDLKTLV